MTLLVIDKEIDTNSNLFDQAEKEATLIINFGRSEINSPKLRDLSGEYNDIREDVKIKYLNYVAEFGEIKINNKSIKEIFLIKKDCSLWWFSEVIHKDSFNDPFFNDLCKAVAINRLKKIIGAQNIRIFTDSRLLNKLSGKFEHNFWKFTYSTFRGRISFLFYFCKIKIYLLSSGIRDCRQKKRDIVLFYSNYPLNWTYDENGNYSDRFFRELPVHLNNYGYIIFLLPSHDGIKKSPSWIENAYFIHNNIGWLEIFFRFFNLTNFFKYLWNRKKIKKQMVFEGIDICREFDQYLLETMILNDLSFWVQIRGAEKIIKKTYPSQIICGDEFGAYSRSLIIAAKTYRVMISWLQHAVMSKWKLWLFNKPQEISNASGDINKNFIANMPVADRILVWSKQSAKYMSDYGYPASKIIITGNPRYDIFRDKLREIKVERTEQLILTPTTDRNEIKYFILLAEELVSAFPNKEIVIKFHPRYKHLIDLQIEAKIQELMLKGVLIKDDNVEKYYHNSNIIISGLSSVGIEAAYFGMKVVSFLSRYHDCLTPDWIDESSVAYSPQELIIKLNNIEKVKELDWTYYYGNPGEATDKILNILNNQKNNQNSF